MKKGMKSLLVLSIVLLPTLALGAGFAKDPIFLSKTPVTEGQSVHVYAVISNPDASTFLGTLVFYDNTAKIGTVDITLAAGGTQTASILWTPTAGPHPLQAQLVAKDGTIAEQVSQSFTIQSKPQPAGTTTPVDTTSVDSSAAIQKDISNLSPQVGSAAAPAFGAIDSARNSIAAALNGQINNAKQKIAKPGVVEGASTEDTSGQGIWYWIYSAYLFVLQGLLWLVENAGVFYPVIAILFLYFLYRMYRRFRRPY